MWKPLVKPIGISQFPKRTTKLAGLMEQVIQDAGEVNTGLLRTFALHDRHCLDVFWYSQNTFCFLPKPSILCNTFVAETDTIWIELMDIVTSMLTNTTHEIFLSHA